MLGKLEIWHIIILCYRKRYNRRKKMKTLVVYYSQSGNAQWIAERISVRRHAAAGAKEGIPGERVSEIFLWRR